MKYLIISQSCQECGGDLTITGYNEIPTNDQIRMNQQDKAGGMSCLITRIFKECDGEPGEHEFIEEDMPT